MKKVKVFLFLAVFAFAFLLLGANVKTNAATTTLATSDKIVVKGASVRLTDPSGLRFVGTTDGYVAPEGKNVVKYGIALAYGKQVVSDEFVINGKVDGLDVINGEVDQLDEKNQYYVALIGIPTTQYDTYFTARAYVVLDDATVVYGAAVQSRNLSDVVLAAKKDGAEGTFIDEVYKASETVLNLNGGKLLADINILAKKYNTDKSGAYLTLCSKGNNNGYSTWWDKFGIDSDPKHPGLYKITEYVVSGKTSDTLVNHEFTFAVNDGCLDKTSLNEIRKLINAKDRMDYLIKLDGQIPSQAGACEIRILASKNAEVLYDNHHFALGDKLPAVTKDYYTFDGWFANPEFTGNKVEAQDTNRELFAKFTPINYTINFELNEGTTTSKLPAEYNIESNEILLPTASEVTKEGHEFGGWYDNPSFAGEAITKIATKSHDNKTFYAKWISKSGITVELSQADKTALENIKNVYTTNPLVIVNNKFTGGNVLMNNETFTCGENAYSSLAAALSSANLPANAVIYVFAGTYTDDITITKTCVITSANFNIAGNASRNPEAAITGKVEIKANNVILNGIKVTGDNSGKLISPIAFGNSSNSKIINCYLDQKHGNPDKAIYDNNRRPFINQLKGASCANIEISNNYFVLLDGYLRYGITFNDVENLTVVNNTFMGGPKPFSREALYVYRGVGTLTFKNNNISKIYQKGFTTVVTQ